MTNNELNEFIKNYIENDKTHSAIMLTAPWGAGKSYYIKNELIPYLQENGDHICISVSLYGLKNSYEISKSIFIETRMKFLKKNSEKKALGILTAKTIIKGITSHFGVDLKASAEDLQELYESIDLSKKLIILEDIERTEIDIFDILGYVNSLVEQDEVKVLLVANEDELIKYESSDDSTSDDKKIAKLYDKTSNQEDKNFTDTTQQYLIKKEKTVGDTIRFVPNKEQAIKNILSSFKNETLDDLMKSEKGNNSIITNIVMISNELKCDNLRSVIYGCQKTVDLYKKFDQSFDNNFLKSLLFGNVAFSLKMKMNDDISWDSENSLYSYDLGTYDHPLLYASYEFIKYQNYDKDAFKNENRMFCEKIESQKKNKKIKELLNTIYYYHCHYESEVKTALDDLIEVLNKTNDIPLNEYGQLAHYLISIKYCIGYNDTIQTIHDIMLNKLNGIDDKVLEHQIMYHNGIKLENQEAERELGKWTSDMLSMLQKSYDNYLNFDYKPESINDLSTYCLAHKTEILYKHSFAKMLDIDKTIEMLKRSTPSQIDVFRGIFLDMYRFVNIKDYFAGDKKALEKLEIGLKGIINEAKDKVIILQLTYFDSHLLECISRL